MPKVQLFLLRHGEAEEAHGRSDRHRALTRRGQADAARLGQMLLKEGVRPAIILSSDALRARETAQQIAEAYSGKVPTAEDARLYLGGLRDIVAVMSGWDAASRPVVILVGHNPGFSLATAALGDSSLELSTAEAAELVIDASTWDEALQLTSGWELRRVWR